MYKLSMYLLLLYKLLMTAIFFLFHWLGVLIKEALDTEYGTL